MQIEIFTLCDTAQSYQGKLVVVGTFNLITANSFPILYNGFSIVGHIAYEEGGDKDFKLSFISPDGKNFIEPLSWKANVDVKEDTTSYVDFNIAVNEVKFENPGIYKIILETEGQNRVFKLYLKNKQQ